MRSGWARQNISMLALDDWGVRHVDGQLADVGHVVTDALEMFDDKQQACVTRGRPGFVGHHCDQVVKELVIEIIKLSITLNYFARRRSVIPGKSIKRTAQHRRGNC